MPMQFLAVLLVTLHVAVAAASSCYGHGSFEQEHWPFCQELKVGLLMYFGPSVDGDYMKLGLHVENHDGWSSLAIGGNGGMKGAQQIVVRKVDGAFVAEERYSTQYAEPELQGTQEVLLFFSAEEAGSISWGVLLPTRSCKAGERYAMEDVGMFMHWALGHSHTFSYHKSRGQFHANLVAGPPPPAPDMSSFQSVSMTMPNVPVVLGEGGNDETNPYICSIFDLAEVLPSGLNVSLKHHVAKFAPVIPSETKELVHHMILFECTNEAAMENNFTHHQVIPNCERMIIGCQGTTWPWAVGGEPLVLPEDVGVPIGEGARWYALQMHYYNPNLIQGLNDSSGVSMTLAPSTRTHDAGTMGIIGGALDRQHDPLPPGVADHSLPSAVLPAQCSNRWPVEEVNVLGVMHHAHLVGKKLALHVTRNGEYLGEMRREKAYDFNHQSLEDSSIKKVRKGDEVSLTCSYDTSSRTEPTNFGDVTTDEMCLAYFLHYPALPFRRVLFLRAQGDNRITLCPSPEQLAAFGGDDLEFLRQNPLQLLATMAVSSTAPAVDPPACQPRGDLRSLAAMAVLSAMGVDTSVFPTDGSSSARPAVLAVAGAVAFAAASSWLW